MDLPEFPRGTDITDEMMQSLKTAEPVGFELYNLATDVGEQSDLQSHEPQRFARMKQQLIDRYHEVRTESPTWPAWEWPKYEGQRIEWPEYRGR